MPLAVEFGCKLSLINSLTLITSSHERSCSLVYSTISLSKPLSMRDPLVYPKLRWPIELNMQEHQRQHVVVLRCPLGVTPQPLVLIAGVATILKELTGERSTDELVSNFSSFGVTPQLLSELLTVLDQHYFLESPRFYAAEKQMKAAYKANPSREAYLAGLSYSAEAGQLREQVTAFIGDEVFFEPIGTDLKAVIAPHIDYRRGGATYGKAYAHLQHHEHDLYIILGTAHAYSPHLFHLSEKNFMTPLGCLPSDKDFVQSIAQQYGLERSFADEILHKREHSLELQTPFLHFTKGEKRIVPILVGSFYSMLQAQRYPEEFEVYERFVESLYIASRERLAKGDRLLFIASVDMAHVGKHFGDAAALSPHGMEHIAERDAAYLRAIASNDKHQLFDHIAEDMDARRICGFPIMYVLLDLFERLAIRYKYTQFDYQQAVDYQSDCAVTFAAAGLYAEKFSI